MGGAPVVIDVYVPAPGTSLREQVWPGSGVVGSEVGDTGRLRLDYEGDPELYPTYVERVRRATERHCWQGPSGRGFPTRACAHADPDQVVRVGQYDPDEGRILVTNEEALAAWLQVEELDDEKLIVT